MALQTASLLRSFQTGAAKRLKYLASRFSPVIVKILSGLEYIFYFAKRMMVLIRFTLANQKTSKKDYCSISGTVRQIKRNTTGLRRLYLLGEISTKHLSVILRISSWRLRRTANVIRFSQNELMLIL